MSQASMDSFEGDRGEDIVPNAEVDSQANGDPSAARDPLSSLNPVPTGQAGTDGKPSAARDFSPKPVERKSSLKKARTPNPATAGPSTGEGGLGAAHFPIFNPRPTGGRGLGASQNPLSDPSSVKAAERKSNPAGGNSREELSGIRPRSPWRDVIENDLSLVDPEYNEGFPPLGRHEDNDTVDLGKFPESDFVLISPPRGNRGTTTTDRSARHNNRDEVRNAFNSLKPKQVARLRQRDVVSDTASERMDAEGVSMSRNPTLPRVGSLASSTPRNDTVSSAEMRANAFGNPNFRRVGARREQVEINLTDSGHQDNNVPETPLQSVYDPEGFGNLDVTHMVLETPARDFRDFSTINMLESTTGQRRAAGANYNRFHQRYRDDERNTDALLDDVTAGVSNIGLHDTAAAQNATSNVRITTPGGGVYPTRGTESDDIQLPSGPPYDVSEGLSRMLRQRDRLTGVKRSNMESFLRKMCEKDPSSLLPVRPPGCEGATQQEAALAAQFDKLERLQHRNDMLEMERRRKQNETFLGSEDTSDDGEVEDFEESFMKVVENYVSRVETFEQVLLQSRNEGPALSLEETRRQLVRLDGMVKNYRVMYRKYRNSRRCTRDGKARIRAEIGCFQNLYNRIRFELASSKRELREEREAALSDYESSAPYSDSGTSIRRKSRSERLRVVMEDIDEEEDGRDFILNDPAVVGVVRNPPPPPPTGMKPQGEATNYESGFRPRVSPPQDGPTQKVLNVLDRRQGASAVSSRAPRATSVTGGRSHAGGFGQPQVSRAASPVMVHTGCASYQHDTSLPSTELRRHSIAPVTRNAGDQVSITLPNGVKTLRRRSNVANPPPSENTREQELRLRSNRPVPLGGGQPARPVNQPGAVGSNGAAPRGGSRAGNVASPLPGLFGMNLPRPPLASFNQSSPGFGRQIPPRGASSARPDTQESVGPVTSSMIGILSGLTDRLADMQTNAQSGGGTDGATRGHTIIDGEQIHNSLVDRSVEDGTREWYEGLPPPWNQQPRRWGKPRDEISQIFITPFEGNDESYPKWRSKCIQQITRAYMSPVQKVVQMCKAIGNSRDPTLRNIKDADFSLHGLWTMIALLEGRYGNEEMIQMALLTDLLKGKIDMCDFDSISAFLPKITQLRDHFINEIGPIGSPAYEAAFNNHQIFRQVLNSVIHLRDIVKFETYRVEKGYGSNLTGLFHWLSDREFTLRSTKLYSKYRLPSSQATLAIEGGSKSEDSTQITLATQASCDGNKDQASGHVDENGNESYNRDLDVEYQEVLDVLDYLGEGPDYQVTNTHGDEEQALNEEEMVVMYGSYKHNNNGDAPRVPFCDLCQAQHPYIKCERFKALSEFDRLDHLMIGGRCMNCFRRGHRAYDCGNRNVCSKCQEKHHVMVHDGIKPMMEKRGNIAKTIPTPQKGQRGGYRGFRGGAIRGRGRSAAPT